MYCPSCGSEERQATQFCRACGTDLRTVRVGLEHPDAITASAVSAREEIGRAVAQKIREIEDPHELRSVTARVLPEIEKFLESHEEKRLRRLRTGMITALVGLAVGVPALVFTSVYTQPDVVGYLGLTLILAAVTFATGLGLLVNGLIFTKPRPGPEDNSSETRIQNLLDQGLAAPHLKPGSEARPLLRAPTTSNLTQASGSSVTEHTTHHLKTER